MLNPPSSIASNRAPNFPSRIACGFTIHSVQLDRVAVNRSRKDLKAGGGKKYSISCKTKKF